MALKRTRAAAGKGSRAAKSARKTNRPLASRAAAKGGPAIAVRVQAMVERELDAVERVLAALEPLDGSDAERSARTLASLARTLRELARMDGGDATLTRDMPENDDAIPRDLDEFRRELARRIEAFVDDEADGGVSGAAGDAVE